MRKPYQVKKLYGSTQSAYGINGNKIKTGDKAESCKNRQRY